MKETTIKATLTLALAGLSVYFQNLLIPLIILLIVIICDYVSGMIAAGIKNELSSRAGIIGIVKKVSYLIIVTVGMVIDWIIQTALLRVGVEMQEGLIMFGLLVTVWLIINELLSILENMAKIGVPLPPFLSPLIRRLKLTVEEKAENNDKNARGGNGADGK